MTNNNDIIANMNRNNYFQNIELYAKTAQLSKDRNLKASLMENILASAKEYFSTDHSA